jgi:hypothetical protein
VEKYGWNKSMDSYGCVPRAQLNIDHVSYGQHRVEAVFHENKYCDSFYFYKYFLFGKNIKLNFDKYIFLIILI